jgi:hypothetical protein
VVSARHAWLRAEGLTPCPPVFANEPFRVFPPCPSFETLKPVPPEVIGAVGTVVLIVVVLALITLAAVIALSFHD